jgi:hypothetical protein
MHAARRIPAAFFLLPFLASAPHMAAQQSQPAALQAVRAAVSSELQAADTDKSIWMYRDSDDTPDKRAVYETIETRDGNLRRMIELNGAPLSPSAAQAEATRIEQYVHDQAAQSRNRRNGSHDDAQAAALLRMLPQAFVWTVASETPQYITLSYRPDPSFNPPDMEARVMSIMGGEMIIARDGNRIRTLKGALTQEVKFGYGLFGHLDQGGTFDIERREVGGGHWQITESHVHIGGKALIFKTIGQQEDEVKTDWRPSPAQNLEQAAQVLTKQY